MRFSNFPKYEGQDEFPEAFPRVAPPVTRLWNKLYTNLLVRTHLGCNITKNFFAWNLPRLSSSDCLAKLMPRTCRKPQKVNSLQAFPQPVFSSVSQWHLREDRWKLHSFSSSSRTGHGQPDNVAGKLRRHTLCSVGGLSPTFGIKIGLEGGPSSLGPTALPS